MKLQQPTDRCTVVGISILHREVRMPDQMQELIARMPTREFAVTLPDHVVEEFHELGFTKVARITTDEEIEWLREVYDLFFSGELELPKGALVRDVNRPLAKQREHAASQVLFPESLYPQLRQTLFYRNSERMARQLLVGAELHCWGHMLRKPGHSDGHVPWHQDEAYWDPHFDHQAAAFWMPQEDCPLERGAMSFLPGSHKKELMLHGFPDDDPSHTGVVIKEEFSKEGAVPHPIMLGGASIHHHRVVHVSGPNTTDQPRRVYAHVWNNKAVQRLTPHDRPWYWQKKEARDRFNNQKEYYTNTGFLDATRQRKAGS
jgi:ectoine hydroxylase-related dioxygenase (phytanoyl-CoA dioxygenase family)